MFWVSKKVNVVGFGVFPDVVTTLFDPRFPAWDRRRGPMGHAGSEERRLLLNNLSWSHRALREEATVVKLESIIVLKAGTLDKLAPC